MQIQDGGSHHLDNRLKLQRELSKNRGILSVNAKQQPLCKTWIKYSSYSKNQESGGHRLENRQLLKRFSDSSA
jgi:hypothetical protein